MRSERLWNMLFVYNNIAAIYIAIASSLIAWIYGGTISSLLETVVPWLMLFMVEIMLVFPQKRFDESSYDARLRVWGAMKKDPLVWTSVFFIVLLAVPFVNTGLCVNCDRDLIAAGSSPDPQFKFLPFCVNKTQHLNVFYWFLMALSSMIAVKHSLNGYGKRLLLRMIVWNGALLAVLGFVQSVMGAPGPLWKELGGGRVASTFFSTFGYPNMAGDYFTTLFAMAIALWRQDMDDVDHDKSMSGALSGGVASHRRFWRRNHILIPAILFFFAAINTLSRAAMILICLLTAVFFAHTFLALTSKMARAERFRKGTIALFSAGIAVFVAIVSVPDSVQREVDTLSTDEILLRVTGKGQYHDRVATEIWKEYPVFGCGGWGYKHFCIPKMTPQELKHIQSVGGINVHNDYLQFLAEHGLVGFGSLVAIVVMLLMPVVSDCRKMVRKARFSKSAKYLPKPYEIFAVPAPVFCIMLGAIATFIHGFGDCPLRSPAVLTLFFVSLAALPGFIGNNTEQRV